MRLCLRVLLNLMSIRDGGYCKRLTAPLGLRRYTLLAAAGLLPTIVHQRREIHLVLGVTFAMPRGVAENPKSPPTPAPLYVGAIVETAHLRKTVQLCEELLSTLLTGSQFLCV